jgi:hypothetical protein
MKPFNAIKPFQIRWNEPMGIKECPYAHRWVLNLNRFAIRIHRWHRSDDKRYLHDHPFWFITMVIKGSYTDVSESNGAIIRDQLKVGSIRFRPALHKHYVDVPKSGATTLLITGPPIRNWGFYVNGKFKRPLKFFDRYGHPPCEEQ